MKKCRNLPYRKCFAKSDIAAKNRSLQGKAQNKRNYYIKTPAQLNVRQEIYPILNSKLFIVSRFGLLSQSEKAEFTRRK